ncbi:MAG: class I SAM-dependent methyltransferase [Kiritimatiellae bacterium]|nr:class I SAM-dependent methyltransferase [Kiritimatiellia bacterium]
MKVLYKIIRTTIIKYLESSDVGFLILLRIKYKCLGPHGYPEAPWYNAVLKTQSEADDASGQVAKLSIPSISDPVKNWDSIAALDLILNNTDKNAKIFDAGGEMYSVILPWLFLYGYRDLIAGNLIFDKTVRKGPIIYKHTDITKTGFESESLDVVTCLSVIEHGVDLRLYFAEMSRIIKHQGILITSADYFETAIDTSGKVAYGVPIHIFTKEEMTNAIKIAEDVGFELISTLDMSSEDKVVNLKKYSLEYTFIIVSMRKVAKSTICTNL